MISNLQDAFDYIENKLNRRLAEIEKNYIRCQMFVLEKRIQDVFDELGIDYSDVEIK